MKLARMLATKGDLSTGDIWYPSAMKELEMKAHFLFQSNLLANLKKKKKRKIHLGSGETTIW